MGTMHKEVVKKRRDVAIVISIVCMSLAISLSNFLAILNLSLLMQRQ